ncbi:MAG: hypothetical protein JXB04_12580, partial [Kiritimatiellae bacterium]|nr:hypothetical protein [Kiritimatiellia bacterium]
DDQAAQAADLAERLRHKTMAISRRKLELARDSMQSVLDALPHGAVVAEKTCFIIAGDITYDMAHDVPRPEQSTGEMVRGSDLDVIVVAEDDLPAAHVKELDNAVFKKKHFLLVHPDYREELDYVIKGMAKVRRQLEFDTFEHMVACKIMHEGQFLCGSPRVFRAVKDLIEERGIAQRLAALEARAQREREAAEHTLLKLPAGAAETDVLNLFYTREESEEIY